jgi:hypothetical protein
MGRRHRHLNRTHCGAVIDLDSRFITGVSDGGNPTGWPNRGNSANNFTRSGTASGLVYDTNQQGGQPRLRYPNTSATLRRSSFNPVSWGYSNAHTIVSACRDGKGNGTERLLYNWTAAVNNIMELWAQYSDNVMYFDYGKNSSNGRISAAVSTTSSPVILSGMCNGSSGSVRRNGVQVVSGAMSASVSSSARNFDLGSAATSNHWVGDYYTFIHGPIANESIRRRIEHSVAYSFKIANG